MLSFSFPRSEPLWCLLSVFLVCFSPELLALQLEHVSTYCFFCYWILFMVLSGTIPSNLTNIVDNLL